MNKTQEKQKFKAILNKGFLTENDKAQLKELFKKHPSYARKKGTGIKDIVVEKTKFNNNTFVIVRNDFTKTDISYIVCIDGQKTKKAKVKKACRNAVRPIIKNAQDKVMYGIDRCQFTGEVLTKENTHIDHYNLNFNELFKAWIKDKNVDYLFSQLNDTSVDMEMHVYFTNAKTRQDFIAFHNKNTHLRAISKTANLKRKRK